MKKYFDLHKTSKKTGVAGQVQKIVGLFDALEFLRRLSTTSTIDIPYSSYRLR